MAEEKMGFLSRLFGGGGAPASVEPEIYKGLEIRATPKNQGGQWLTAGSITKPGGGEENAVHNFIRADTHTSKDDAIEFTMRKAKQIIDEQGDTLFK